MHAAMTWNVTKLVTENVRKLLEYNKVTRQRWQYHVYCRETFPPKTISPYLGRHSWKPRSCLNKEQRTLLSITIPGTWRTNLQLYNRTFYEDFLEVEEITDNLSLLSIWRNFEKSIFLSSFQHRTTIKIIKIHLRTLLTLFIPLYYFVLNPAGKTRDTLRDSWKLCAATLPWSKIILLRYLPRLQDSSLWQPPTLLLMGDKKWEVLSFAHRISGKACKGN